MTDCTAGQIKPLLAWVIIASGKVRPDIYHDYASCMEEAQRLVRLGKDIISVANIGLPAAYIDPPYICFVDSVDKSNP